MKSKIRNHANSVVAKIKLTLQTEAAEYNGNQIDDFLCALRDELDDLLGDWRDDLLHNDDEE